MPRDELEEWKARDPIIELRKQTMPHFYVIVTLDMTDAIKQREKLNSKAAKDNKISLNDMVVKAAALALAEFPQVNNKLMGTISSIRKTSISPIFPIQSTVMRSPEVKLSVP